MTTALDTPALASLESSTGLPDVAPLTKPSRPITELSDSPTVSVDLTGTTPAAHSILLVEDNQLVSRALSRLLTKAGYQTIAFTSAQPALDYAKTTTPSAAVIDVHLPDLSGLIVARTLRDHFGPDVPIVVCSGDTSMETLNSLRHVGATYFIPKPLQASRLIDQLNTWLRA